MPKTPRKKKPQTNRAKKTVHSKEQSTIAESSDLEDLLIDMVVNGKEKALNGTDVENLIYNTTSGLCTLGYGFGFSVGRAATLKLGQDVPLTAILDRIGLHDSLYYPFRDKVIITSRPMQVQPSLQLGSNVHVYEAGVISGYLSTSTGMHVVAQESRCVYNGAKQCQFSAVPLSQMPKFQGSGIDAVADAISSAFMSNRYSKIANEYHRVLAYLPLTDARISEQILKLMMIAGERMGSASGSGGIGHIVPNIANYFGVKAAKVEKKGMRTIIKLRYESYNSLQAFVAIPAAVIVGFAKGTGRLAQVHFATNRDGTYTSNITIFKKRT